MYLIVTLYFYIGRIISTLYKLKLFCYFYKSYKWFSYLISALWQWNPLSQLCYLVKNVPVLNNRALRTNKHETESLVQKNSFVAGALLLWKHIYDRFHCVFNFMLCFERKEWYYCRVLSVSQIKEEREDSFELESEALHNILL